MSGIVQDRDGTLRLQVAGKRTVQFAGAELPRIEDILTTAAGVIPRRGDVRADIKAWKFVCAWNARQVADAAVELRRRVETAMAACGGDWDGARERIEAALAEDCPEAVEKCGDMPLADLAVGLEWPLVAREAGGEQAAALQARFERLLREDAELRVECLARSDAMAAAERAMAEPVDVVVAEVAWAKVPGGLSGGYLRELVWMFKAVPPMLLELIGTDKPAGPEGVDSAGDAG